MKKISTFSLLRTISLVAVVVGAAGSLSLMFYAGREQKSVFLIALFTGWVLSPFIALVIAIIISRQWPVGGSVTLYCLVLFITVVSLVGYSDAWSPPGTKNAFKFLIVPLISWLLIVIVILVARRILRRSSDSIH